VRLSDFYEQLSRLPAGSLEFAILLAAPDNTPGETVDVHLSGIGWVEIDDGSKTVKLFPASAIADNTPSHQVFCIDVLLRSLPVDASEPNDLTLTVELPLNRDRPGHFRTSVASVQGLHISLSEESVWLLVRPKEDFPDGVLPS
jgi:hypothetical protein